MTDAYKDIPRQIAGGDIGSIKTWAVQAAEAINRHNQGKFNVAKTATLTASATTTTIKDSRISPVSALLLSPLTANAAAAVATTYVSAQGKGEATLTHANNAQTDRIFRLAIVG